MENSLIGSMEHPTISSPLVKRRSHVRPASTTQKRVSFHQDQMRRPDDLALINSSYAASQYYLNYGDDRALSCNNRFSSTPNMRRYHSEIAINQSTNSLAKYPTIAERGVPEGQEDPESPKSDVDHAAQDVIFLSRKTLVRRKSVQSSQINLQVSSIEKRQYLQWAKKKWENIQLVPALPFNSIAKNSVIIDDNDVFLDKAPQTESFFESTAIETDPQDKCKSFKCFVSFYWGTPRQCQLVVSETTIYTISFLDSIPTTVWKTKLIDLLDVKVKWNYSMLVLRTAVDVSEYCLDFVDPSDLHTAASLIDVNLRKLHKEFQLVYVETFSQCQAYWQSCIRKWTEQDSLMERCFFNVEFIGLLYFQESFFLHDQETDAVTDKCGYLMFRWSNNRSWHPGYFAIRGGVLYQFNQPNDCVPALKMSLSEEECKGYGRNYNSKRPHTIELQLRGGKSLLLAAASDSEATGWLASLSQSSYIWDNMSPTAESVPVACGILVTQRHVFLFKTAQMDEPIASAPLDTISVIMVSVDDNFCLIELEYREASEGAGDWIFYFQSENSLEEFLRATKRPRESLSTASSSILRNKSLLLKDVK